MICKNCGTPLSFSEGLGRCPSCGSQYETDPAYADFDVFISYVENDSAGRRTKDSILANEIYQKLESKKIKTFYERATASALVGDPLELARQGAFHGAKIVLLVGASAESFNRLMESGLPMGEKRVILPIYTDINPYDLPESLSKYQALNYGGIGADADLVKNLLRLLGREAELDLEVIHRRARKRRMILLISVAAAVLLAGAAAVWFFFLRGEKPVDPTVKLQQDYAAAQALEAEGKYLEAAALYLSLGDFQDSADRYKNVYNHFDGAYLNEEQEFYLHINIQDAATVAVQFIKNEGGLLKHRVEQELSFSGNTLEFSFMDHKRESGTAKITLQNDRILVECSLISAPVTFLLTDRTDREPGNQVTPELIQSWLNEAVYLDDLIGQGFELEYRNTPNIGGEPNSKYQEYGLKNTNVRLLVINFDYAKYVWGENEQIPWEKGYRVYGVVAPASLLLPGEIGQKPRPFIKNGIFYVPDADTVSVDSSMNSYPIFTAEADNGYSEIISQKTLIGAISKAKVGNQNFYSTVLAYLYAEDPQWYYKGEDGYVLEPNISFCAEAGIKLLFSCESKYHIADTDRDKITAVTLPEREGADSWQHYPDVFTEFVECIEELPDAKLYYTITEYGNYYYTLFFPEDKSIVTASVEAKGDYKTAWRNDPTLLRYFEGTDEAVA